MRVPRTLVPEDCRAPAEAPARAQRRLKTWLDDRKLVPQDMPVVPFEGRSTIPSHVPLDVLNNRVLIGRDMPVVPFPPELAGGSEPLVTELDDRVVVPQNAHLEPTIEAEPFSEAVLRDLVETDVLVSGEARLLPEKQSRFNWDFLAPAFSVVFHVMLIVFFLTLPHMLAPYEVTPAQEALNQQNLGYVYLPKNLKRIPKPKPVPQKRSDKMRIETGKRNRLLAPPKPEISQQQGPAPAPVPKAQPPTPPPVESAENRPQPRPEPPKPKPQPRLEPVTPDTAHPIIAPPDVSPGRALKDSLRAAAKQAERPGVMYGDRIPLPRQGPGGPGQQGGPGKGYLENGVQILTPTEGVDFSSYIARLLTIVKRNWYAVMPESAMLGDKGRVMLRFRILRNGDVPGGNPIMELSSGKRPLDRAAVAAITASNPFDPLPSAYTRPYIELRIIFLYNLPLHEQ
jgi:TonB family protein